MATLRIIGGPDVGKTFELGDTQILGRLPQCEIPLADDAASRKHARVFRQADGYWISDLGSANGTTIEGRAIRREMIPSGTRFRVGTTVLEISYEAAVRSAPAATRSQSAQSPAEDAVAVRNTARDRVLHSAASQRRSGRADLEQWSEDRRWLAYLLGLIVLIGSGLLAYFLTAG